MSTLLPLCLSAQHDLSCLHRGVVALCAEPTHTHAAVAYLSYPSASVAAHAGLRRTAALSSGGLHTCSAACQIQASLPLATCAVYLTSVKQ